MFFIGIMAALICLITGVGLLVNHVVAWGVVFIVAGIGLIVFLLVAYPAKRKKCSPWDCGFVDCGAGSIPDCDCLPDCGCGAGTP
ncbi:hypothetical protein HN020_12515 [Brevibacillus borstelensis]|uniref:hypothetical protein n=1 Tax=Brevibacillus borstelensis TaxID=45462 RepID=UPI00046A4EB2|nr:hypothetical protein [Brevibacillus borstelensis]MCC0564090.1 hypothetical protein [Brevibacillus borstelensis]MCM3470792.1 hypothetical protein [Brevibacillus borstelensis]MCM3558866.1 hypothetical protein [Brevibacillus borstelensis]MCM3592245.1 hypothetical protein [Brevibacillus borstelensis]MCM3622896.1 hypothetical protein [Brevibacillus borstelensis]